MKVLVAVLVVVALSQTTAEKKLFDHHAVYRIIPKSEAVVEALKSIEETAYLTGYDFFTQHLHVNVSADILVPPTKAEEFATILNHADAESKLLVPNIQKLIDAEGFRPESRANTFTWTNYHTLDEINAWLKDLALNYPDSVELLVGGRTYEGRDILGVKVSFSPNNKEHSVFIEANIHAREWITSAVATYFLNELIVSQDPDIRDLADSYDWYIFPVFNPDGFAFSHAKRDRKHRLWRKTRTPYVSVAEQCYGADPNRNWPYLWMQGGASNQPCDDIYAGPKPLSEPSIASLSQFIDSIGPRLDAYISVHSYAQKLLLPYGHTTQHLDNYEELFTIGQTAINDLASRYGTKYIVGTIAELMGGVATGSSLDYVKNKFGTPITYAYELRDTGIYGFVLPAEQIIPTSLETIDSLVSIFRSYRLLHPRN